MGGRAAAWLAAIVRLLAFGGLFIVFGLLLGAVWTSVVPLEVQSIPFLETVVTTAAALAAGAVLIRMMDGRSPAALGIAISPAALRHTGVGLLIGAAGLLVAVAAMLLSGALAYAAQRGTAEAWITTLIGQAAIFTVAAFAEEALFRGYPFQVLTRYAGPVVAVIVSSVLFALAHGANPSIGVFALVNIFLAGILLAIAYLKTLSLWFATALHMAWNWTMATLFDLPVSGLEEFDTPLYEPAVSGAAWWSGAAFGPEGGLVGTLGFAAALLLVLRWKAVRPDPAVLAARPLVRMNEEELNAG